MADFTVMAEVVLEVQAPQATPQGQIPAAHRFVWVCHRRCNYTPRAGLF